MKKIDALERLAESQQILEFVQFSMTDRSWPEMSQQCQQGYSLVIEHVRERIEEAQGIINKDLK
ncbi:hypothetical protein EUZ85_29890 [Hahella sp. KA22]|uniref:hypothetical protein n=1 Tax=Hahella sp. KA22 TaxID=1628392 RepID=UPI000FDE190D|nr:hypothetical protein [Hahella sp. KA22]AZZ94697.1 hypothetical protein ENC22_27305 [Hahella sp. KA22]QAY58070.1 hypothetical protein EUZ85_29890 [Hahella sp. KA22]